MKNYTSMRIGLLALIFVGMLLFWSVTRHYLTFDQILIHKDALRQSVTESYAISAAAFIALYISTAFFLPGALLLSLIAGFLFGTVWGAVYINVSATIGAALSFLAARYFLGNWAQRRYATPLSAFNKEIARHGNRYLFTLRVVPIMPFFIVNILAGLTKIPLKDFIIVTSLGVLPGSLIYANAGRQLANIKSSEDIMSWKPVLSIVVLVIFALAPVLFDHLSQLIKRN